MMLSNLQFFLTEALIGMRRSGLMIVIAVGTVIVSLLVFGFFLLGTVNLHNLSKLLADQLEIRLFLNDSLTIQEIRDFEDKVKDLKGIKTVTFVHHDEAWTEFRDNFHNLTLPGGILKKI